MIDSGLANNGTLGLTLLDLFDHWAFSYGLLICGFLECVLVGWVLGPEKLRNWINQNAAIKIPAFFDIMISGSFRF